MHAPNTITADPRKPAPAADSIIADYTATNFIPGRTNDAHGTTNETTPWCAGYVARRNEAAGKQMYGAELLRGHGAHFAWLSWVEAYGVSWCEGFALGWDQPRMVGALHTEAERTGRDAALACGDKWGARWWIEDQQEIEEWRQHFAEREERNRRWLESQRQQQQANSVNDSDPLVSREASTMIAEQPSIELLPAVQNRFADQPIVIASGSGELSDPVDSPMMFEHIERIARMIAFNRFCPAHLSKGQTPEQTIATCFRIAAQAVRWHVDPFALADETYEVRGKLGYQGKLIASIINARAGLDGRLSYTTSGTGDDLTVTVSGKFKNETEPRTVQAVLKHSRTDNEMWKKDPEQKLCYVGAIKWARRHYPEIITGVLTTEDLDVIAEGNAPAPESEEVKAARAAEARAAQRAALAGKVGAVEGAPATVATAAPAPAVTATPQAKSEATVAAKAEPAKPSPKPATTKPEPRTITTATLADEALKAKVRTAWTATGKPNTEFASHVAEYGKAKLSDLTQIEADDLLGRLLALDPNATKDSARGGSTEAAGTVDGSESAAAKTRAGELPTATNNAEGAKDGLYSIELPDDPFAALSVSYGTSSPEQRAEFESLAKELKWNPDAFFKRNRTPVIGQMSAQVAARGIELLKMYKAAGEAKVVEAAEATFGQQSVYEYTGAQLTYLAGVLACPF